VDDLDHALRDRPRSGAVEYDSAHKDGGRSTAVAEQFDDLDGRIEPIAHGERERDLVRFSVDVSDDLAWARSHRGRSR
jgi:hypothetical protein